MSLLDWMRRNAPHRRGPSPIGIDFAPDAVHWVQLNGSSSSPTLRDVASVRLPGDVRQLLASRTDLKAHIREVLRRGKFRGRSVVTGAPSESLRLMVLNFASQTELSEPEQIMQLTRERMRDDLQSHVVDYVPIRTSGDRQGDRSALVAVIPEEPVLEHLDRLSSAGLEVSALEIEPVCIRRLISNLTMTRSADIHTEALHLVLRFNERRTALTLLSGQRLLLYREIEYGGEDLAAAVSKGLECELDAARELISSYGVGAFGNDAAPTHSVDPTSAEEINSIRDTLRDLIRPSLRAVIEQTHKAISYAAFQTRGSSLERVLLMEGVLRCPGMESLLGEMLQIPVEIFRPLADFSAPGGLAPDLCDARVAIALGHSMRGIDHA